IAKDTAPSAGAQVMVVVAAKSNGRSVGADRHGPRHLETHWAWHSAGARARQALRHCSSTEGRAASSALHAIEASAARRTGRRTGFMRLPFENLGAARSARTAR